MFKLAVHLAPFIALALSKRIDIQVGVDGALKFTPEAVAADVGDEVFFTFATKNHTVTQSSFANPCGKLEGGIDSGFKPVTAGQPAPTFNFVVNNTDPTWIYCAQGAGTPASHCNQGMVFAVNCGLDGAPNSFTNFQNAARAAVQAPQTQATTAPPGTQTDTSEPVGTVVTQPIILGASSWTTTYTSYPGSPEPTPAALEGRVIKVIVGGPNGNLTYTPSLVSARPRDTIQFEFHVKNHTVTQSSFANPCKPLIKSDGSAGFDSGFKPVADQNAAQFPTYNLVINDTAPIYAYCRQTAHCSQGMVFAVNTVESSVRNFNSFQAAAKASGTGNTGTNTTTTTNTGASAAQSIRAGTGVLTFVAAFAMMSLVL